MFTYGYGPHIVDVSSGRFLCPNCQIARDYKQRRLTRHFKLGGIPMFQLKNFGEFIECQGCYSQFNLDILKSQPNSAELQPEPLDAEKRSRLKKELIELWESLYNSLNCEAIIERTMKGISVNDQKCAYWMKQTGGAIFIEDYKSARDHLNQIRGILAEVYELKRIIDEHLKKAKPKEGEDLAGIITPEILARTQDFLSAIQTLLRKLP